MDEIITCLDSHKRGCGGETVLRPSLSGTGTPIARCDVHWDRRLRLQNEINDRYPTHAPSDFDPAYAGERWDEDY